VERYTLLASFLLGLVYGRSSAAKAVPVDPQIAIIPPGEVGGRPTSPRFWLGSLRRGRCRWGRPERR